MEKRKGIFRSLVDDIRMSVKAISISGQKEIEQAENLAEELKAILEVEKAVKAGKYSSVLYVKKEDSLEQYKVEPAPVRKSGKSEPKKEIEPELDK